jgi:glutamyl-tRNA reductase
MSDQHADPAAAIASMYDHGEAVKREAVETATAKLAADGALDAETEAAVETLADRLVEGLLGPPTASLVTAEDDERAETALRLFGSTERDGKTAAADGGREDASGTPDSESDPAAARAGD